MPRLAPGESRAFSFAPRPRASGVLLSDDAARILRTLLNFLLLIDGAFF
jgi:hypothetical protein